MTVQELKDEQKRIIDNLIKNGAGLNHEEMADQYYYALDSTTRLLKTAIRKLEKAGIE